MEKVKESNLNSKLIHIDEFVTNPDNVNEMNEEELKNLCSSISEFGLNAPVQVVPMEDGKFMLLGGEHRWKAAKRLGMSYIPAIILDDAKWSDKDIFDLYAFRLNVVHGSQNPEKFIKLYDRFAKSHGVDALRDVFAITDKTLWKKLTKNIKTDLKKSGMPDDVIDQVEKADEKAKSFDEFIKSMNKVITQHSSVMENGSILFSNAKSEHLVIHASNKCFDAMKALSSLSSSQGKNINEYLEKLLTDFLLSVKT